MGCDTGKDLWHLVRDHHVSAVELAELGAEIAGRQGIEAHVATVTDRHPFTDGVFDIVVVENIVEHVADPVFALEEAAAVMKTGR